MFLKARKHGNYCFLLICCLLHSISSLFILHSVHGNKSKENILAQTAVAKKKEDINLAFESKIELDPILKDMLPEEIDKIIKLNEIKMKKASKDLDFFEAARLRDEITELNLLKEKN